MAAPVVSLDALITAAREENRHAARKIAACYDFHLTCIAEDAGPSPQLRSDTGSVALQPHSTTTDVPPDPTVDPDTRQRRRNSLASAAARLRDRHCRFPGCHRPAARCQLDHVNPFDHANPLGGGWTTVNNLQCLCEYHHSVKTAGYWTAAMLPGGAILWTSTSKTTRITLPANGTTVPIIGNDLRPHIPTQPKRSGIIAYPDPPDNPTPEPESTNEEDEEPPF